MKKSKFNRFKCSTDKCKRPVIAYEFGDHWCKQDLKRVTKLRDERKW